MRMPRYAAVAAGVSIDAAIWFSTPLVFLYFYVRFAVTSTAAIAPHLLILFLVFLTICALRLVAALLLRKQWKARCAGTVLWTAGLLLQLVYYPTVIVGLNAWGQVISWDLIRSYAVQAVDLTDALGLSLPLALLVLCGLASVVWGAVWWLLGRNNWPETILNGLRGSRHLRALVVAVGGLLMIPGAGLAYIFGLPDRESSEPLVTTFFPNNGVSSFRGFAVDAKAGEKIDREHDAARAAYLPNGSAAKRNLVLIVVDALRPDHMHLYGYARDTTPHLSKLAQSSTVITRIVHGTRAVCSESPCGLFGMASSRYFHEVSARPFTLQQVLRKHGYDVRMILGGDHTNFYGLRDLYGKVDSYVDGSDPSAKYSNSDRWVIKKAEELPMWAGTPTMIQFHLMSAHPLAQREPEFTRFRPATTYVLTHIGVRVSDEHATNFYDNGVLQTDDVIDKLLRTLAARKYLQDALVVITADHGDALGEHGLYTHANGVREAVVRIPLIFLSFGHHPPALSGKRAASSQVDIAPTILRDFDMPIPAVWRGHPLQAHEPSEIMYLQQGDEIGLIDLRYPPAIWKYWIKSRTGREFAFNLANDPNENHNLIDARDGIASGLLRDWRLQVRRLRPVAEGR